MKKLGIILTTTLYVVILLLTVVSICTMADTAVYTGTCLQPVIDSVRKVIAIIASAFGYLCLITGAITYAVLTRDDAECTPIWTPLFIMGSIAIICIANLLK